MKKECSSNKLWDKCKVISGFVLEILKHNVKISTIYKLISTINIDFAPCTRIINQLRIDDFWIFWPRKGIFDDFQCWIFIALSMLDLLSYMTKTRQIPNSFTFVFCQETGRQISINIKLSHLFWPKLFY